MKRTLVLAGCIVACIVVAPAAARADGNRIVHLELKGAISEAPVSDPFGFSGNKSFTTKSLLERMRQMRHDDTVEAVFLTFESPALGLAQVQEIRKSIEQLRVEKEVYVHMDSCYSMMLYWLASAASRVSVVPTGDLWITGLYGEQLYLKDMLAHLHMEADVIHIGDYKSAGEIVSRNGPSEPAAEMMTWLYDDIYAQMLEEIGASRGMDSEKVGALVDQGPYSAEKALEVGLIDSIDYRMEFVDYIKKRHGQVPFDKNYGKDSGPELNFNNPLAIWSDLMGELMGSGQDNKDPRIGLVYVVGMIIPGDGASGPFGGENHGASSRLRKALYRAARDDTVKAVVLRVDSPGGSAVASEIIWNATQEITRNNKPFIVSMGNVAGSGGYYVSCGADTIFAEPGTITGSIGVVGMKLVTKGFWEWMGVHWHPIQRGENSAIMATSRPFSDRERDKFRTWMEDVYGSFKDRILRTRKDRLTKPLESIAGGRVYTGRQALDLGLVDRMGGLEDALRFAALEANLGDDFDVEVLPKPKTLMDILMEGMGMEASLRQATPAADVISQMLPYLQTIDPLRAAAVKRMIETLTMFQRERVMTVMPIEVVIQ